MNAIERAVELMAVKAKDLPPRALVLRDRLFRKYGGCMEVALTAFAAYAQVVEGRPCDDALYVVSAEDRAWLEALK